MNKEFYIVNPKHKHSWMMVLMPEVISKEIPHSFYYWLDIMGATVEILPRMIKESYFEWVESSTHLNEIAGKNLFEGQIELLFFCQAQISWI